MSIKARTAAVLSGALAATAIAGVAALASPNAGPGTAGVGAHEPAHMDEMIEMMDDGATVGEMHQWMAEQGMPIGEMHRQMTQQGANPGSMHRSMAEPGDR